MRPAWALLKYSLLSSLRYRSNRWWPVTEPLLLALPALLVAYWGEQAGYLGAFTDQAGTEDYLGYMLLGALYWNFVEVVWWIALALRGAMREGTLESVLATSITRLGLIGAWSGARMLVVIPTLLAGVGLLGAFSGFPPWPGWGEAVVVVVLSVIGSYGFAFLLFGLTLRFKDADSLISLMGNAAPLLGGVFFPVTVLPAPLRSLSLVFPFTYGADALRGLWFGTPTLFPAPTQYAVLGALGLAYLGLGWWALGRFERRARLAGMEWF